MPVRRPARADTGATRVPAAITGPTRTGVQGSLAYMLLEAIEAFHLHEFDGRQWAISLLIGTTVVSWLQVLRRGRALGTAWHAPHTLIRTGKLQDGDPVIVLTEDGRRSDLGTFQGWTKRPGPDGEDAWHAHVVVCGPRAEHGGSGMHRDCVHHDRVLPLIYCNFNPVTRETFHRPACIGDDLMQRGEKVWA